MAEGVETLVIAKRGGLCAKAKGETPASLTADTVGTDLARHVLSDAHVSADANTHTETHTHTPTKLEQSYKKQRRRKA